MEGIGLTGLYEICFEQSWKMMKEVLESKGVYRKGTGTSRKQQAVRPQAAQTGARCKGNGLAPLPLIYSKDALIYHMNVACAVLQTAFCASRHKRTGERPAERRTAHGNLPLQYQIRKSVYSILQQEQREQQPRRAQDMER